MDNDTILDLADLAPDTGGTPRRRRKLARLAAGSLMLGASGVGAVIAAGHLPLAWLSGAQRGDAAVRLDLAAIGNVAEMTVDDSAQIVTAGKDAQARNEEIPLSGLPIETPGRIVLASSQGADRTALKCMTQAIYYEAAHEPLAGRRAVAQVVINRVRHPAYPSSVCGVVYQGSERRTGCQFSFTCDGSLLRAPAARPWAEAQEIARAALAGTVEKSVGTATHYHADYVLPKWAFGLGKITRHGRHIFYRFKGGWGRSAAFTNRYSGNEHIPAIDFAVLRARLAEAGDADVSDAYTPGLTVTPHVTDRHAASDVGGRLDVTKEWRLTIPDPVRASSRYREAVQATDESEGAAPSPRQLALAAGSETEVTQ